MSVFATGQLRERREVDFSFIRIAEIRVELGDALWAMHVPPDCQSTCVPAIYPADNGFFIGCNQIGDRDAFDLIFIHCLLTSCNLALRIAAQIQSVCCNRMPGLVKIGYCSSSR